MLGEGFDDWRGRLRWYGRARLPSRVATAFAGLVMAAALSIGSSRAEEAPHAAPQAATNTASQADRAGVAPEGQPEAAARPAPPVASAVRVVRSGDTTRMAFDITAPVDARAFVMADPDRVIVDLPETSFAIEAGVGLPAAGDRGRKGRDSAGQASAAAPAGLVASYRFGLLSPGRSRIVIDLASPARVVRAGSETSADGQLRLIVDLSPLDRDAFRAAAAEAAARPQAPPPGAAVAKAPRAGGSPDSRPVVVIDPGHGGIDSGAQGPENTSEKEIVLAFSKTLAGILEKGGRYTVVMTRDEDVFVSLADRVRIAREANAQLFLSVHADSLNQGGVSGATVYTVSDKASDAHAAMLAEKENFSDKAAGFDGVEDVGEVSGILFDLTRRETRAYSHVFARTLVSVWKEAARLNRNPLRSAGFRVLKAPDVPSALLELGYLSNERDAALLLEAAWREKTAAAVARSIDAFFAMRAPETAEDRAGVASILR